LDMVKKPGLELGAGVHVEKRPGWINADLYPGPNIHVVMNATDPWPFDDNSLGMVNCSHVIEHLPNLDTFMNEAWRVLDEPPGQLRISNLHLRLPHGPSEDGFGDITHVRHYTVTSWNAFSPHNLDSSHNPQHQDRRLWSVYGVGRRINRNLNWLCKPVIKQLGRKIIPFLWGGFTEMIVDMSPIKSPERLAWWQTQPESRQISVYSWMYDFEYYGKPKPETFERNTKIIY
jgi:SAM-dependent methyltransferase